jgi:hypothetical protein
MLRRRGIAALLALVVLFGIRAEEAAPKHLLDARDLIKKLDFAQNSYQHGNADVAWNGQAHCHADCSGFLNAILKHSYGYDEAQLKRWFGAARPNAARFHDAIVKHTGFTEIERMSDLRAGDILAVKYKQPAKNSGHILMISGAPKAITARKPLQDGTQQWEVPVIDSSESGHGPTDTRHAKGADGKDHDGVGEGVFRIYAGNDGKIVGYSWSLSSASHYIAKTENDLVAGRLVDDFKP